MRHIKEIALAALAATVLATEYVLADTPPTTSWFKLSISVADETVPKGFVVERSMYGNALRKTSDRECVFADGAKLEDYKLHRLESHAKSKHSGYGARPAHVEVPKPDQLELDVWCDRKSALTHGHISFKRRDGSPGQWARHVELELAKVEHALRRTQWGSGPIQEEVYVGKAFESKDLCTISSRNGHPWVLGDQSIPLTKFAGHLAPPASFKETAEDSTPPSPITFEVYIDCYSSRSVTKVQIDYALR